MAALAVMVAAGLPAALAEPALAEWRAPTVAREPALMAVAVAAAPVVAAAARMAAVRLAFQAVL
jgi:hypothetical protein